MKKENRQLKQQLKSQEQELINRLDQFEHNPRTKMRKLLTDANGEVRHMEEKMKD